MQLKALKDRLWHAHSLGIRKIIMAKKMRRLKKSLMANNLLVQRSGTYKSQVRSYWQKHFGKSVNPMWHVACANVIGVEDVRYIPHDVWEMEIAPFLNNYKVCTAYSDKNLFNVFLKYDSAPVTLIKFMHGNYYDGNNQPVERTSVLEILKANQMDKIIKPSLRDGGYGVTALAVKDNKLSVQNNSFSLAELERFYGADFLIQEKLRQHANLAEIHPESVNTIRVVTFRWNGAITVLLAFARFGTGGKITDNAASGGICCGIDSLGKMYSTAIDSMGRLYPKHPTSRFDFGSNMEIPNYKGICDYAISLHRQLYHFDIVSWDFAVGEAGQPVFLEVNFLGASYVYQFASRRPLFGDLTEAVLEKIRDSRTKS